MAHKRNPEASTSGEDRVESDTARRMLEIAERLFAEQGVELVPLRQIMLEAGQRNRSALHYHFGSREELVSRLLNLRLREINTVRNRYLDEVEAAGLGGDVRAVVEATIRAEGRPGFVKFSPKRRQPVVAQGNSR